MQYPSMYHVTYSKVDWTHLQIKIQLKQTHYCVVRLMCLTFIIMTNGRWIKLLNLILIKQWNNSLINHPSSLIYHTIQRMANKKETTRNAEKLCWTVSQICAYWFTIEFYKPDASGTSNNKNRKKVKQYGWQWMNYFFSIFLFIFFSVIRKR